MKRIWRLRWAIFILISVCAATANADAGTPLMWAGFLHLFIGNLLLGILEGGVLVAFFKAPPKRAFGWMIPANYFSAWVGYVFLAGWIDRAWQVDLYSAWHKLWIMVGISYLLTLVLELPFIAMALGKSANPKRLIKAVFITQSISYLLIITLYVCSSFFSLYSKNRIVPPTEMKMPAGLTMYYILKSSGDVVKSGLNGEGPVSVKGLSSKNVEDRLFLWPAQTDQKHADLYARLDSKDGRPSNTLLIASNIATTASVEYYPWNYKKVAQIHNVRDSWMNFGDVPSLGSGAKQQWSFHDGFWPAEGLSGTDKQTQVRVNVAFETPYGAWPIRNAVQLPNDFVIFQLGDDQICVFDPSTRRIAKIADGRGPVVVVN